MVRVACSSCAEEAELTVEELDDVDREACPCGYSYVVVSVGSFRPVEVKRGRVIEFPRRHSRSESEAA